MFRYSLLLLLILFPLPPISAQEKDIYNDSSYFIPGNEDFNLIMAASRGHLANVRNLIERGADVNAVTLNGVSALMYASDNGDLDMVQLLLSYDANPDLQPVSGITALISAVKRRYFEVAEYLVTHGANPDLRDEEGATAVNYAAAYNYPLILEMLIYYGADISIADNKGNTPLITAAYNGSVEALNILLKNNAHINEQNKQGNTPLMAAVQKENITVVDSLLKKGAKIDISNDGGMTALAFAVETGSYELTEKMINNGADFSHKINNCLNILELAKLKDDEKIVEYLRQKGAETIRLPYFNKFSMSPELNFNSADLMMELNFGIQDYKYNLGIVAGFGFRPSATRIISEETEKISYQYWERRYYFHLGVEKKFMLFHLNNNFSSGPLIRLREVYSFGNYRGSSTQPEEGLYTVPSIGWYIMDEWIGLYFLYEYMNYNIKGIDPGRFAIGFDFNISLRRKSLSEMEIEWIEN